MKRSYCSNHFIWYSEQCGRNQQESKRVYKHADALPQCTGQVKVLAAVMNDMKVPENIDMMTPAMDPVTGEVNADKSDHVNKPGRFDLHQCNILYQPGIGDDI